MTKKYLYFKKRYEVEEKSNSLSRPIRTAYLKLLEMDLKSGARQDNCGEIQMGHGQDNEATITYQRMLEAELLSSAPTFVEVK